MGSVAAVRAKCLCGGVGLSRRGPGPDPAGQGAERPRRSPVTVESLGALSAPAARLGCRWGAAMTSMAAPSSLLTALRPADGWPAVGNHHMRKPVRGALVLILARLLVPTPSSSAPLPTRLQYTQGPRPCADIGELPVASWSCRRYAAAVAAPPHAVLRVCQSAVVPDKLLLCPTSESTAFGRCGGSTAVAIQLSLATHWQFLTGGIGPR